MSAHTAAVFTAFLFVGGTQSKKFDADKWHGQIGFAQECAPHGAAIAAALDKVPDKWDYPGVLEYEIVEPLGEWIATREGYTEPRDTAARFLRHFREWVRS